MGGVFINYRRGETAGEARALFNELTVLLGKDAVFMDVDNIALGRDFRQVLRERLESCEIMLALIGKDWIDSRNRSGQRRLDEPNDFVRLEIEAALKRNIPVTPVLVQGAQMPNPEQLPEVLGDFAYRNAFELSHNRWESDVQEMLKRLGLLSTTREVEGERARSAATQSTLEVGSGTPAAHHPAAASVATRPMNKIWLLAAAAVAIALGIGGVIYYRAVSEQTARTAEQMRQDTLPAKAEADAQVARAKLQAAEAAIKAERDRATAAQADKDRAALQAAKDKGTVAPQSDGAAAASGRSDPAANEMCGLVRCRPVELIKR